jgi:hypothetical protein
MNPADPGDPFDPMGPPRPSSAPKVLAILVGVVLVLIVAAGAIVLFANGGGDDSDAAAEVATEGQSDEPPDTTVPTTTTAPADEAHEENPAGEPDADHDGVPDAQDDDDDDDGVPDAQDPDDDGDGTPDDEEVDGDGADDGDAGDDADPGDEDPPAALDLLRNDPRPAVDAWIDVAGDGAKAVEVVLYTAYGFADIRDPEHPNRLLQFGWRDGAVEGPEPADPFPGTDLDAESFRMTRVAWDALPRLVANAPERAGLPRGEVTHVIVTSDAPFSDRFLFRIYVTAPDGRSDYVVATIDGHPAQR